MRTKKPCLVHVLSIALFTLTWSVESAAQEDVMAAAERVKVDYQLIFPDEKAPEQVRPEEENPFVAISDLDAKQDIGNSEENQVKEKLLSLEIVGASPRADGYRVQLGDMILEAGMLVPPFLPDQSVQLRVNTITDTEIEFIWLERQRTGLPPRTLIMPMQIKPVIRYALSGQSRSVGESADPNSSPIMGIRTGPESKTLAAAGEGARRAEVVEDEGQGGNVVRRENSATSTRPKSSGDAVLDMFFNSGAVLPQAR